VEAALDALYTTPPPAFVPRREELAARARTAGRAEDARRLRAARRPTLAAWAANLLLRSRPEEAAKLLELGRALRAAYRTLDAAELKSLTAQRRVVAALSRQAADLADAAGHRLSDAVRREVESTLDAVLADEEAAERWATGRLHTALTPPSAFPVGGFSAAVGKGVSAGRKPRAAEAAGRTSPAESTAGRESRGEDVSAERKARVKDELAERRRKRREEWERAREAAEAAARRLDAARSDETEANTDRRSVHARREAAERRVADAERELREARAGLREARAELRRADADQDRAERRHRDAAHALDQAERQAAEADRTLRRLTPRG
jgi:hypothetical protein